MSTKTTFKRVALVAVASLGFGVLTSIAPANANAGNYTVAVTATNAVNTGTAALPIPSGTAYTANLVLTTAAASAAANTVGITFAVTAGPEAATTAPSANITASCTFTSTSANLGANNTVANTGAVYVLAATGANAAALAAVVFGTVSCPTTIGGTYTVAVTENALPTKAGYATITATGGSAIVSGVNVSQGTSRATTVGAARVTGAANVIFTAPTRTANAQVFTVTSSGVGSIQNISQAANATITRVNGSAADYSAGGAFTSTAADVTTLASVNIAAASTVAGLQTISTFTTNSVTGIQTLFRTATITWGATPVISAALSTAFSAQGNARSATLEVTAMRLPSTAGVVMSAVATTGVSIALTALDGDGTALNAQAVTATISGPGLLSATSGNVAAVAGTARVASLSAAAQAGAHQSTIGVSGDGTRGVATITITVGGVVLATKTVTFYGAVATLTATQGVAIMIAGRTATSTPADFVLGNTTATATVPTAATSVGAVNLRIVAADVDGNVVPIAPPTAEVSNPAAIDAVVITDCVGGTAGTVCAAGAGNFLASTRAAVGGVSGAASTVTFRTPHPTVAGTFISTAAVPFTLGGSTLGGTVTMTLNKAAYEPGERMILTFTAKDAAGNPVSDWRSTGTPSANKALGTALAAGIYVKGSHIFGDEAGENLYAPVAPGVFIITLGTGTATGATITATATVADDAATGAANAASDAAAEAIDAANAATDAANLAAEAADAATVAAEEARDAADAATAAVEALATEVATLMAALKAQITTLANTVAKIAKKVKA